MSAAGQMAQKVIELFDPEGFQEWWARSFKNVIPLAEEKHFREMAQAAWEASRSKAMGISIQDMLPDTKP